MNKHILASLVLLGLSAMAWGADEPKEATAERARIAAERSRIEATFEAERKACYSKFSVSGCIEDARARRSAQLGDLRRQEISLNDAQRKARAADRVRQLDDKQADEARKRSEAAAKGDERAAARERRAEDKAAKAEERAQKAQGKAAKAEARPRASGPAGNTSNNPATRPPLEKPPDTDVSRRRYEERQLDAQAHRASVEQRAAEQQKKNKSVQPLPVPP
jgi:colicin import membrane protein